MRTPWPHQSYATDEIVKAAQVRGSSTCISSPTGGGKTDILIESIKAVKQLGMKSQVFTHRRLLFEQVQRNIAAAGIQHGLRASGFRPDDTLPVQISSIATELARLKRQDTWSRFPADVLFIDEAHVNKGPAIEALIAECRAAGVAVVGFTATPVDLASIYDKLIVAGRNSDLRACRAHLAAHTYAPSEFDLRGLKPVAIGEDYSASKLAKRIMQPAVIGEIIKWYNILNPDRLPAIFFGPSVPCSLWACEQFNLAGIPAAHIDGTDLSFGETDEEGASITVQSTRERREEILAASREGKIKILCNRFVLREAIDMPWIYHAILGTAFGSLSSYLQAAGRLLRFFAAYDHKLLQDQGGNYWRHGSINADREWELTYTNKSMVEDREQRLRNKSEPEPIVCPKCAKVRQSGDRCPACGHKASRKSRMIIQLDGTLMPVYGDIFKPRRVQKRSDTEVKWEKIYYRMKRSGKTFKQAEGLFFRENRYWPPRDLPLMPLDEFDFGRKVADVPRDQLHRKGAAA